MTAVVTLVTLATPIVVAVWNPAATAYTARRTAKLNRMSGAYDEALRWLDPAPWASPAQRHDAYSALLAASSRVDTEGSDSAARKLRATSNLIGQYLGRTWDQDLAQHIGEHVADFATQVRRDLRTDRSVHRWTRDRESRSAPCRSCAVS